MNRKLLAAVSMVLVGSIGCRDRVVEASFWFDPVTFDSPRLDGPITARELATIETIARDELTTAFNGLRIRFATQPAGLFRVRVAQSLESGAAGESRTMQGFGGGGSVSFSFLANGVFAHSPDDADRPSLIAAIGRAIGRTAAHEFTHQLVPTASIHDSKDPGSYEYPSAVRREQYYGELHWDFARPLLEARLGRGEAR